MLRNPKPETKAKATKPTLPVKRAKVSTKEYKITSRVGSQIVLEGEQMIIDKLRQMDEGTINQVITEILKDELNTKGQKYVLGFRGWQFYSNLKKHVSYMKKKQYLRVTKKIKTEFMVRPEEVLRLTVKGEEL